MLSTLGSAIYASLYSPAIVAPPVATHYEANSPVKTLNQNENLINIDQIVEKILENPKLFQIFDKYRNNNKMKLDKTTENDEKAKYADLISELRLEISRMSNKLTIIDDKNNDLNKIIAQIRLDNANNLKILTRQLGRCCHQPVINLEAYVSKILTGLLNNPDFLNNQRGLNDWLHAIFVSKQQLESHLSNLTGTLDDRFDLSVDETAKQVMDKVIIELSKQSKQHTLNADSLTDDYVKKLIKQALAIYDADKTGLVDYAMEPMGGQILTTRCTESYHAGTAVLSIMGIPLWYPSNTPRTVITPGVNPGECWAFQNFPGFLVIKLANRVKVEALSMEHISRLLAPGGRIDSAPKEFEVWGLASENDNEPIMIGDYVYDVDGDPLQFFAAEKHGLVFEVVEVRVKSNHGNPNYTCLYRFRVHGSLEPT